MADGVRIALTLVAGVASGVLSAAFGVGGAVVTTPAIRALGAGALEAVGTTLPAILPSAVVGSLRYRREGLIRWDAVAWTGGTGAVAAVAGAALARHVPGEGHLLMLGTAVLMAFTAIRVAATPDAVQPVDPQAAPEDVRPRGGTSRPRLALTGVLAGVMSGLLGIGGGIVMVPAFTAWLRFPIKEAIGTSLACVGILAIPGTATHALLGGIDWSYAVPLALGVIPGAWLGSALTLRATDRNLRFAVAGLLAAIAAVYGAAEVAALL
jgi:uncharacterized membrane protein YfcA